MKKMILTSILLTLLIACAESRIKNEWSTNRYSKKDIAAIDQYYDAHYNQQGVALERLDDPNYNPADDPYTKTFCVCYKKLGEKCRQKSVGLNAADKELWLQANAADMASAAYFGTGGHGLSAFSSDAGLIDADVCEDLPKAK